LNVVSVRFVKTVAAADDLPRDGLPQLALVGRSNVGKSSLINALARARVARTSGAPGKTRLANFYQVELAAGAMKRLYLVDLPGYGYARARRSGSAHGVSPIAGGRAALRETAAQEFDALAQTYFGAPRVGPAGALLLVDARHPGLPSDVAAWAWLLQQNVAVAVVAAKMDKLTRAERLRHLDVWQTSLNAPVLPVSAATGEGMDKLWLLIVNLLRPHPRPATPTDAAPTPTSSTSPRSRK
jgi:GTP-binding protein